MPKKRPEDFEYLSNDPNFVPDPEIEEFMEEEIARAPKDPEQLAGHEIRIVAQVFEVFRSFLRHLSLSPLATNVSNARRGALVSLRRIRASHALFLLAALNWRQYNKCQPASQTAWSKLHSPRQN